MDSLLAATSVISIVLRIGLFKLQLTLSKGNLMKPSRLLLVSAIGGCAGFFAMLDLARRGPSSFIVQTVNNLGVLYGILLFTTGLFAILSTSKKTLAGTSEDKVSGARWIVGLPALIGMIGVLHGYLGLAPYYSRLSQEIPHVTIWSTAMVGVFFTIVASMILLAGRRTHKNISPLTS
jgi:hypothetical protein